MYAQLEYLIALAEKAGKAVMEIYSRDDFGEQEKSDHTPVTLADLAANKVLLEGLAELAPDIPVMSEESPIPPLEERKNWTRYWLLDPLDGTGEFILKSGDFAVNIALIENNRPILGIIHWPAKKVTYFAGHQQGCFKREREQDKRLHVTQSDHLRLAVSRRQPIEKVAQYVHAEFETYPLGSCSLKACIIAEGQADCFLRIGPTGEWDTGASQIIVEEAGGEITDAEFNPLSYNLRETTENPDFIVMGHQSWNWKQLISPHQR